MDVRQPVHASAPWKHAYLTVKTESHDHCTECRMLAAGIFLFIASVRLPNLFDFLDIKLSLSIKKNNSAFAKT